MIAGLRGIVRAVAAVVFLAVWGGAHLVTRPFARGVRGRDRWRRRLLGGGCRGVLRLLNVRIAVEGRPPSRAGVLVTNHLSYVDVLVLGALFDAVFVSRADVKDWPGIGLFARGSETIFLDRGRKRQLPGVVEHMRALVERGVQVVFFPEGTSGRGDVVMPFRSSLFEVPVRAGVVAHAAALDYRTAPGDEPAETAVCWWGDADFLPHLWSLLRLRGVDARVAFADAEIEPTTRKEMARRAQEAVQSRFRPSAGGPLPEALH
jgi:1-acyl-sn-glycerol-3-phosphate acyltransferase